MQDKSLGIALEFMKEQFTTVNNKIEKLSDKQNEMNTVLTENTVIVKEHERRSLAIEEWAGDFENRFVEITQKLVTLEKDVEGVATDLGPVKTHVESVSKLVNFIAGLPKVLSVTVLLITILSSFYGVVSFVTSIMPRK